MSALAFDFDFDRPPEPAGTAAPRRLYAVEAPPRLDATLGDAFASLRRSQAAACPVCASGTLHTRWSPASGALGGRCADCGTTVE